MIRVDLPGIRVLGKRWEFSLCINDAHGQPLDLTGATVTVALGTSTNSYASKSATIVDIGLATAVFLPSDTLVLPIPSGGRMYYQVDVQMDANNIDTVACGYFVVQKSLI